MNSLNIDFRDDSLRVLRIKDGNVVSAKLINNFYLTDSSSARDKLLTEISEFSGRFGRVNIILPQNTVHHLIEQVPKAGAYDISMILRRRIAKELSDDEFTCGFREIIEHKKSRPGTQNILLEYVRNKDLTDCLVLLKECGIKPDLITSSLEGNIQLFNRLRPETEGNEAIIDIGSGNVEIMIINSRHLVNYDKLPLLMDFAGYHEDDEDQTVKIKIYKIVDLLFNSVTSYIKSSGTEGLSRLWVCGTGSALTDITDAISSGFGIKTGLLNDLESAYKNGSSFSALSGVSRLTTARGITNFIPASLLQKKKSLIKGGIISACIAVYLAILIAAYAAIEKTENELRSFIKSKEITVSEIDLHPGKDSDIYADGKNMFFNIISASPSIYGVLSDIASLTPSGVRLENIDLRIEKNMTILTIDATIKHSFENYSKALLTKHLSALEGSDRLKSISIPAIATSSPSKEEDIISVKSSYEVKK